MSQSLNINYVLITFTRQNKPHLMIHEHQSHFTPPSASNQRRRRVKHAQWKIKEDADTSKPGVPFDLVISWLQLHLWRSRATFDLPRPCYLPMLTVSIRLRGRRFRKLKRLDSSTAAFNVTFWMKRPQNHQKKSRKIINSEIKKRPFKNKKLLYCKWD